MICVYGVMVSVLTLCEVDSGFKPLSCKNKDYEIGICCFSAKHAALKSRAKPGWLGIRIMWLSEATCLHADCCFIEVAL